MSASFYQDLIDSGWYGSINEVGLGVPLLAELLRHNGASKVLFHGQSTYAWEARSKELQGIGSVRRAVTEKTVMEESRLLFAELQARAPKVKGHKLFAYSVSGTYKTKDEAGETHCWAAVTYVSGVNRLGAAQTQTDTFHAWLPKWHDATRPDAFNKVLDAHEWFLRGVLLDKKLSEPTYPLQGPLYIDVVNSAVFPLEDQVQLVGAFATVFKAEHGRPIMVRPHDYIRASRQYFASRNLSYTAQPVAPLAIYRGSFNPLHRGHVAFASCQSGYPKEIDPILEISLDNYFGKLADPMEVAHRVRMLTACGFNVILTRKPRLAELTDMLRQLGAGPIQYYVGSDVFNAIFNPPEEFDPLPQLLGHNAVEFVVADTRAPIVVPQENLKGVSYQVIHLEYLRPIEATKISSSEFRKTKDLSMLPNSVAQYIKEHKLYA